MLPYPKKKKTGREKEILGKKKNASLSQKIHSLSPVSPFLLPVRLEQKVEQKVEQKKEEEKVEARRARVEEEKEALRK